MHDHCIGSREICQRWKILEDRQRFFNIPHQNIFQSIRRRRREFLQEEQKKMLCQLNRSINTFNTDWRCKSIEIEREQINSLRTCSLSLFMVHSVWKDERIDETKHFRQFLRSQHLKRPISTKRSAFDDWPRYCSNDDQVDESIEKGSTSEIDDHHHSDKWRVSWSDRHETDAIVLLKFSTDSKSKARRSSLSNRKHVSQTNAWVSYYSMRRRSNTREQKSKNHCERNSSSS